MQKRHEYIDIAKFLGIFCVILGYVVSSSAIAKAYIYSFHMPLFFIISGIFVPDISNLNFSEFRPRLKSFTITKIKILMVPYFIWALIYSKLTVLNFAYIVYGSWQALGKAVSVHFSALPSEQSDPPLPKLKNKGKWKQ